MIQKAPRDKSVFFITGLFFVLFTFFLILSFYLFAKGVIPSKVIPFLVVNVLLVVILIYCFFSGTTGYEIDGARLKIIRKSRPIIYDIDQIKEAKIIHKEDLGTSFRIGSNGGVFGYSGIIYSKNYGSVSIYLNSFEKDLILIQLSDKRNPILINPENGDYFLEALSKSNK